MIADAVRDRLEHSALQIHITGESYRGVKAGKFSSKKILGDSAYEGSLRVRLEAHCRGEPVGHCAIQWWKDKTNHVVLTGRFLLFERYAQLDGRLAH